MQRAFIWKFILMGCGLTACNTSSKYQVPEVDVPCEWHSGVSDGMTAETTDDYLWWQHLNDPQLDSLIMRAAAQNLDLYIAGTRIVEARTLKKGKTAELYPHIDASAAAGHAYLGKKSLIKDVLCSSSHKNHKHREGVNTNYFEVGFDADWEFDFFGMTAHELKALEAQLQGTEADFYNVWVSLSAEIAKNYIELRGFQRRLEVLKNNIESQSDTLNISQDLENAGMSDLIAVRQAESQLNTLIAEKPLIELSIDKAIHRLSLLLGYSPSVLFDELKEYKELPQLPICKPIGVPSELLRRRPDIRKAERNLAAATERVESAVAALFPRLSLSGFVGYIGSNLHCLLNPSQAVWMAGPQLLLPIFNSRLLKQDVDYNKIQTQKAVYEYQKTVLEALEEAENAIASYHYELQRNHDLELALISVKDAYLLTLQLYESGLKGYLEVLVTNRTLLTAEEAYIQSQVDLLSHYIALYKALGGGWDVFNCALENS